LLDVNTGVARGVLTRVSTLRIQHHTRDAQALWDWARGVGSPVHLGTLAAQPDTPGALLREQAEIQRGLLALRQDTDAAYTDAIDAFTGVEERLIGTQAPMLSGEPLRRVLVQLGTSFSMAGRERRAIRVTEHMLRVNLSTIDGDPAALRNATRGRPPLRAADDLHNHATRLARLANLELLDPSPAAREHAGDLLRRARVCAAVAASLRTSREGKLLERVAMGRIDLEAALLIDDLGERRAALQAVVDEAREIAIESRHTPEVTPSRVVNRQGMYGAALAELARVLEQPDAVRTGQLARICLSPVIAVQSVDAVYNSVSLMRYGDACAITGDLVAARRAWLRIRTRLARARPGHPAIATLEQRLIGG
jgi:hypothetical protein